MGIVTRALLLAGLAGLGATGTAAQVAGDVADGGTVAVDRAAPSSSSSSSSTDAGVESLSVSRDGRRSHAVSHADFSLSGHGGEAVSADSVVSLCAGVCSSAPGSSAADASAKTGHVSLIKQRTASSVDAVAATTEGQPGTVTLHFAAPLSSRQRASGACPMGAARGTFLGHVKLTATGKASLQDFHRSSGTPGKKGYDHWLSVSDATVAACDATSVSLSYSKASWDLKKNVR